MARTRLSGPEPYTELSVGNNLRSPGGRYGEGPRERRY